MGNSSAAGGRHHKSAKEELYYAHGSRRPRAASASGMPKGASSSHATSPSTSSPSPRSGHDPLSGSGTVSSKSGAVIIESPREERAEMLSRLIAEFESDRLTEGMKAAPASSAMIAGAAGGAKGKETKDRPPLVTSQTSPALSEAGGPLRQLQCLFKWAGGGKKVFLAGAFTDPPWQARIPMHRSNSSNFYTIYNLSVGLHDYCFVVDGQWRVDTNQPLHSGRTQHPEPEAGPARASFAPPPQTNCLEVKESDFEVFNALEADFAEATDRQKHQHQLQQRVTSPRMSTITSSRPGSPPGDYTREVPSPARLLLEATDHPPLLPPVLLDGILNADTSAHYDPNLMPVPQHVMLNHLYCLSIKDGMMILASTSRYRKKFVSTVLYRPIAPEEKAARRHSDKVLTAR